MQPIRSRFSHWLAMLLILEVGLLHLLPAQAEYEEAAYMGWLFMANFFGSLLAAFAIHHRQVWGWALGALIAAGSIAGYAWSRTFGMPGMNMEEWFTPYGVLSLGVEAAFLLLALSRPWRLPADLAPLSPAFRVAAPALGVILIACVGFLAWQWDAAATRAFGHHVGTLEQVCGTPATSLAGMEEKYGIQVSLVAVSMMDSIVDVRIKIVDPAKAHALLQHQAALLVGQQALILAPHMHSHSAGRLKTGKLYVMFFPASRAIRPGAEVSLVFGPVRTVPVPVK